MDQAAFLQLSRTQLGVVARRQVLGIGASPRVIERHLLTGRWDRIHPDVYGLAGHAPSWRRRLWAAHLHAGPASVLAGSSAGRIHGFEQFPAGRCVLIVPDLRSRPPAGVMWVRTPDLGVGDVVEPPGLPPTTSPARTAMDGAAVLHVASLRLMVEQGLLERKFTLAEVGSVLSRVRRRGKPGVARLARVLDDLGPGGGIPGTELEHLLDEVVACAGLPAPLPQHPLPNHRGRTGFVDRMWPEARLIVEADGRRWHDRRQQMRADADRTLEAQAMGFETSRLHWEHLRHDPDGTAELLRAIYFGRVHLLGGLDAGN
ncbi:MAG: DUF559 domain-containing protein [Microthrixaceae bacterium]